MICCEKETCPEELAPISGSAFAGASAQAEPGPDNCDKPSAVPGGPPDRQGVLLKYDAVVIGGPKRRMWQLTASAKS